MTELRELLHSKVSFENCYTFPCSLLKKAVEPLSLLALTRPSLPQIDYRARPVPLNYL
jgi:hypothetical protein